MKVGKPVRKESGHRAKQQRDNPHRSRPFRPGPCDLWARLCHLRVLHRHRVAGLQQREPALLGTFALDLGRVTPTKASRSTLTCRSADAGLAAAFQLSFGPVELLAPHSGRLRVASRSWGDRRCLKRRAIATQSFTLATVGPRRSASQFLMVLSPTSPSIGEIQDARTCPRICRSLSA